MLIRNLNTQNGLVNGAMGYVESFSRSRSGKIVSVNVLFDNRINTCNNHSNATEQLSQRTNAIPIEQLHHQFIIHGRHIVRVQFPVILCFACTIHKVQGMSLDKICVDIGPDVFERGMAYVALSRVKCLDGLGIISFDPKVVLPYDKVLEEYDRLRKFNYRK
jgi:ATP-dependent exoDNAse (exonuclease V) alpha subunit